MVHHPQSMIMPYNKKAEFFEKSMLTKDSISKYLKIDLSHINEETLAYNLSKRLNINEKNIAENLSHKINFLNLNTYAGIGYYNWTLKMDNSKSGIQPFSLLIHVQIFICIKKFFHFWFGYFLTKFYYGTIF